MSLIVDIERDLADFSLGVSFEVDDPTEVLALLGPSGCGKSMTLKCIAGVERPDRGHIELDGHVLYDSDTHVDLRPQARHVGYLFQSYALFPTMTVMRNVCVGAHGTSKAERRSKAVEQIHAFRLEGLEDRRPAELSGGQQQRVALARIMASEPDLLLLDEPFSALDGYLRWQIEMDLSDTLRAFPGGTVFVSHNRDEVYRMCDTVCVIDHGRSEAKLPMRRLFESPDTLGAALISGCKNVSRARVTPAGELDCTDWGVTLSTSIPLPDGTAHAGIRAHYLTVEGEANPIDCVVSRVIDNVFSTIVMVVTPGGGLIRWEVSKEAWAALGDPDRITLHIAPDLVMPLAG